MKYRFMQQQEEKGFCVGRMSKILGVSRSGYYRFLQAKPSCRQQEKERLIMKIKQIYEASRQTYGSPRIHAELKDQGETCSRPRVARLMRQAGIMAKMKKKFKITTKANAKAKAAPNLLQQDFTAEQPNQRWVADITYIWTLEGWLYLAAVLDLFSRRIVGLAMGERMTDDLVMAALEQALTHRKPLPGLMHHSDKGSQYTSQDFQKKLAENNITVSMSGTGNCYDNAAMESFFHTLKTEHVCFERYQTREQAKQSIFEYVEVFYNRQRRHSTLNYQTPLRFEKNYQQQNSCLHNVH
jgi:transposase InsO family protein